MKNIMNSEAFDNARRRAEEKVKKLTLKEKIGQLSQFGSSIYSEEELDVEDHFANGTIGAFLTVRGAKHINEIQAKVVDSYKTHIPAIFGEDVIHGYRTTFPIPLAQSCSWNPEVVRRGCEVAAKEAYRDGIRWTFSPMVDIARDPRWGRIAEGYGEDTYLCSQMAQAAVRGYQGDGEEIGKDHVFACMKHYLAYSGAIGGRDYNSTDVSMQTLYDVYLPPFKAGIDAGAATVMTAFEDINGVPATANKHFLTDVLRGLLGFKGLVVSDAGAVSELTHHGFAENEDEAAVKALKAGCDMSMQLMGDYFNKGLPEGIRSGEISIERVDEAVMRVLTLKYLCGIMDEPYTDESADIEDFSPAHLQAARDAATEVAVLMENDGTLPLRSFKRIALVGALAGDEGKKQMLGSWNGGESDSTKTVTVERALREALDGKASLTYAYGCSVAEDGDENDENSIAEAVSVAKDSDVIVCVVGEYAGRSGEAASFSNIHLPGNQEKFINALIATGKPIAVLVAAGRPVILTGFNKRVNALLNIWHMGTMTGYAVADLLLGKACPSGHLTVSYPRTEGQIPIYYNHNNTGRPLYKTDRFKTCYRDLESSPLYPFGYGLSYTRFEYSDIRLSDTVMSKDGEINVSVNVKNVGTYDGAAVVQMYVRDLVGISCVRPVKELKGFEKVFLRVGEEKTVTMTLPASALAFHNADMELTVEPGKFKLWIAEDSQDNSREFDFEVR